MTPTDVAIIGAGPYGLSLAAHLSEAGVEYRIFGKAMDAWKANMPPGMLLKSHPWSTSLYDPGSSFTLRQFCAERAIAYHDSLMPLPLETFIDYGMAFQKRLVPKVEPKLLVALEPGAPGFLATFDDGEIVSARRIVLATGVHPFKYTPEVLSHLPANVLSHSGDYGPLDAFAGKEIAVLGSGASAIDIAALLHEKGASVSLIARTAELRFANPPKEQRSLLRRLAYPLRHLLRPGSGIGDSWLLKVCADAPGLIHAMPSQWRLHLVRTTLGPLGHASMQDRVIGKLSVLLGRRLEGASVRGDQLDLRLAAHDGLTETRRFDHIIAATGYRIDLRRLEFLSSAVLARIDTVEYSPVLSENYESSVPGLYFIGPASANSFGPVTRFVFGAKHPSRRLMRRLAVVA